MYEFSCWCLLCASERDVEVEIQSLDEAIRENIGQFTLIVSQKKLKKVQNKPNNFQFLFRISHFREYRRKSAIPVLASSNNMKCLKRDTLVPSKCSWSFYE